MSSNFFSDADAYDNFMGRYSRVLAPEFARAAGVGYVPQEIEVLEQLSVAENVFAGRQPTKFLGQIDRKALREKTRAVLSELGVSIDPDVRIAQLSPAQGQVKRLISAPRNPPREAAFGRLFGVSPVA